MMADNRLRDLERAASLGDLDSILGYAHLLGSLDKSACYERLCGVFADEFTNDIQLGKARDLFIMHLGGMYVVDQGDRWRVSYFTHDNRFIDEDMDKELFNNGIQETQFRSTYRLIEENKAIQGIRDICELIIGIYQNQYHDDPHQGELIANIRKTLKKDLKRNNLTHSLVCYNTKELDIYLPHHVHRKRFEKRISGNHYLVGEGESVDITQLICGTRDYELIDRSFTDLGNQRLRIWRHGRGKQYNGGLNWCVVTLQIEQSDFSLSLSTDIEYEGVVRGWNRRTERKLPN